MNYDLNQVAGPKEEKNATYKALRKLLTLIDDERRTLLLAFLAIIVNSALSLT